MHSEDSLSVSPSGSYLTLMTTPANPPTPAAGECKSVNTDKNRR